MKYRVPFPIVYPFAVDLEGPSVATATGEDEVTPAEVGAGHVGQIEVPCQKDHSRCRVRPEFDVKGSTAAQRITTATTVVKHFVYIIYVGLAMLGFDVTSVEALCLRHRSYIN